MQISIPPKTHAYQKRIANPNFPTQLDLLPPQCLAKYQFHFPPCPTFEPLKSWVKCADPSPRTRTPATMNPRYIIHGEQRSARGRDASPLTDTLYKTRWFLHT